MIYPRVNLTSFLTLNVHKHWIPCSQSRPRYVECTQTLDPMFPITSRLCGNVHKTLDPMFPITSRLCGNVHKTLDPMFPITSTLCGNVHKTLDPMFPITSQAMWECNTKHWIPCSQSRPGYVGMYPKHWIPCSQSRPGYVGMYPKHWIPCSPITSRLCGNVPKTLESHVPNHVQAMWECTNCMDGLTLKSGDDYCPFVTMRVLGRLLSKGRTP